MKKSIWSVLVLITALALSSCGRNDNEQSQFGIYNGLVSNRTNPAPLISVSHAGSFSATGTSELYLYDDGTYEVRGTVNVQGPFSENGGVLTLQNYGAAIPASNDQLQQAGVQTQSLFNGFNNSGNTNFGGVCLQVNVTSGQVFNNNNFGGFNTGFNNGFNNGFNTGFQATEFFCRF